MGEVLLGADLEGVVDGIGNRRRVALKPVVLRERHQELRLLNRGPGQAAGGIADVLCGITRSETGRGERIVNLGGKEVPNLIRGHARDGGWGHVVMFAEAAKVQMRSFLADVVRFQHYFGRQFLLESEAPRLFVRGVQALLAYRPHCGKTDVVEGSEGISGSRRNAASKRRRELAGSIAQRIPGSGVVDVQGREPRRLDVEPLEAPWTGARGATSGRGEINAVTAAQYERMRQLIGEAKARLDVLVVGVVVVAIAGAGKNLNAVQGWKSRYVKWRQGVGVKPVHAVKALGSRRVQLVAQSEIQRELGSNPVVILGEGSVLEALRADEIVESLL